MVRLAAEAERPSLTPPPPGVPVSEVIGPEGPNPSNPSDERPHTEARARMHPFSLRFEPALEEEFEDEYFVRTLGQVRFALLLAFALYTVFGILDLWMAPAQRPQLWFIRYALVAPLLVLTLAFSFHRGFRQWRERAVSSVILVAALGIVAMTSIIPAPASYLYYAGLLLAVMFVFTLARLSVPYATSFAGITVLTYVAVAIWLNATPPELIVNNLFFLMSAVVIGFSANYSMERYARSNFLQRRVIAQRTRELEQVNASLIVKNRMLAESRAENLRTARRSELIFSALSDALPGTVLDGKYRVEDRIGSGSFGTVYRGTHLLLNHPVAIKIFRPAIGRSALEGLDRFRIEGISACRVNHPNAVTVLDFDVSAGSLAYLVMELLEGHSLADLLRQHQRLEPARCVGIAVCVLNALAEAHAAGIVHRDIKPSNVFLHRAKDEEQVKVIDFGVAKLTDQSVLEGDTPPETLAGTLVGTPEYMAPERLNGARYDGRADVYSVGVMLYEMLTGQLPFQPRDGGYWSLAMMHVAREPKPPVVVEPRVGAMLNEIVMLALAKEPERRPTAADLARALRDPGV